MIKIVLLGADKINGRVTSNCLKNPNDVTGQKNWVHATHKHGQQKTYGNTRQRLVSRAAEKA